jgi:hypothetical protein
MTIEMGNPGVPGFGGYGSNGNSSQDSQTPKIAEAQSGNGAAQSEPPTATAATAAMELRLAAKLRRSRPIWATSKCRVLKLRHQIA